MTARNPCFRLNNRDDIYRFNVRLAFFAQLAAAACTADA
jgi:hypothetical protein